MVFYLTNYIFTSDGSPAKTRLRSRKRGNPVLRRNKVNFRRRNGSTSSQLRSDCDVFANIEDIELFVAEKSSKSSDILMLPGQTKVFGAKDEETILTARTSMKPNRYLPQFNSVANCIL